MDMYNALIFVGVPFITTAPVVVVVVGGGGGGVGVGGVGIQLTFVLSRFLFCLPCRRVERTQIFETKFTASLSNK